MLILTTTQMKTADRIAIEKFKIPGIILMENAGQGAAEIALSMLRDIPNPSVCVIAGKGNNGGDAFVVARHLHNRGMEPEIFHTAPILDETQPQKPIGDAQINLRIALAMQIKIFEITSAEDIDLFDPSRYDLIVDGLFGTGLSGEITGHLKILIEKINSSGVCVLALDIPSGLSGDEGTPLGVAIKATKTATFGALKTGLSKKNAREYTGEVVVIPISIPKSVLCNPDLLMEQ